MIPRIHRETFHGAEMRNADATDRRATVTDPFGKDWQIATYAAPKPEKV